MSNVTQMMETAALHLSSELTKAIAEYHNTLIQTGWSDADAREIEDAALDLCKGEC